MASYVEVISPDGETSVVTQKVARLLQGRGYAIPGPGGASSGGDAPEANVPPSGTVAEVLAWVGEDQARADAALDAEEERSGGPRKTLVAALEELSPQETETSEESDEGSD